MTEVELWNLSKLVGVVVAVGVGYFLLRFIVDAFCGWFERTIDNTWDR